MMTLGGKELSQKLKFCCLECKNELMYCTCIPRYIGQAPPLGNRPYFTIKSASWDDLGQKGETMEITLGNNDDEPQGRSENWQITGTLVKCLKCGALWNLNQKIRCKCKT